MASIPPTATLAAVTSELRRRKGPIGSLGIGYCRPKRINGKLRPDRGYSEHAYGNAEDLKVYGKAAQAPYVAELKRMQRQGFPVGTILWAGNRPKDHTDHIHVEGSPSLSVAGKKPPCAGGDPIDPSNPQTPTGTDSQIDEAFSLDIPLIGEVGPALVRAAWLLVAVVAVVLTVYLLTQGFIKKQAGNIVGDVAKAVT